MKTVRLLISIFTASAVLGACREGTPTSESLRSTLEASVCNGKILFGQQDALLYGHSWRASENDSLDRSDIESVCGKHPAVLGLDLGGIESGSDRNLDGNAFSLMRTAALRQYERGGIVTLSWHPENPHTGGGRGDVSSGNTVASIRKGGVNHDHFISWLSLCADYLDTFLDKKGKRIPMIFRPWHEHTGNWFWWGGDLCSAEEYKELWMLTYDYFTETRRLDNLLWAYSPAAGVDSKGYMERYPGDETVDILGLDCYQYGKAPESNAVFASTLNESMSFMTELGKAHGKLIALTETGFEGIPYPEWWTGVLYPAIKDYPIAYVLVWRNACDIPGHFYSPWKDQESEEDFIRFASFDDIVFITDNLQK